MFKKLLLLLFIFLLFILIFKYDNLKHLSQRIAKKYLFENESSGNKNILLANSFGLKVKKINLKVNPIRTAGILFNNNEIVVYEQTDTQKIDIKFLNKYNGTHLDEINPIRQIFNYRNNVICLLVFGAKEKYKFVSLINLTKKIEIFRSPMLSSDNATFDGIGGGYTFLGDNLLFALGTPSASYGDQISELAQDLTSPFGKVLIFNTKDLEIQRSNIFNFNIFSSGHRNPQGLLNYNNTIYEVEHGPRGGDEINILQYGMNYGWPIYSFGKSYEGNDFKVPKDSLFFKNPVYSFIPSVATSDLIGCPEIISKVYKPYDCILISTLKSKSIFIAIIDSKKDKLLNIEQLYFGSRIREFSKDKLYTIFFSTDGDGLYKLDSFYKY